MQCEGWTSCSKSHINGTARIWRMSDSISSSTTILNFVYSNSPTWPNASLVHRLYKHPTAVPSSGTNDIKDSASCRQASTCLVLPLMEGFTLFSIHGNSFCIPILDHGLGATWVDPALRWVPTPSPFTASSGFQQGIQSTCQPSTLEKPGLKAGS